MNPDISQNIWQSIVNQYREACLLQEEKRAGDARVILRDKLPSRIREWSRLAPESAEEKKERLRRMFADERQRVTDLVLLQRLIVTRTAPPTGASLPAEARAPLSTPTITKNEPVHPRPNRIFDAQSAEPAPPDRRIPIEDIAGMIDAIEIEQSPSRTDSRRRF